MKNEINPMTSGKPRSPSDKADKELVRLWLRNVLDEADMKPAELARRIGRPHSTISKVLNPEFSDHTLSLPVVLAIIRATGVEGPWAKVSEVVPPAHRRVPTLKLRDAPGAIARYEKTGEFEGGGFVQARIPESRSRVVAVRVDTDEINRRIPRGALALIDLDDVDLVESGYYLIDDDGSARLLRYLSDPDRFEPNSSISDATATFDMNAVTVCGRLFRAIVDL